MVGRTSSCWAPVLISWHNSTIFANLPVSLGCLWQLMACLWKQKSDTGVVGCFLYQLPKFKKELSSCWGGQPFRHNMHGPKVERAAVGDRSPLGPHLTHCGLGWGLLLYQVASWSVQPFGHNCRNATLLRVGIRLRTIFIPMFCQNIYRMRALSYCSIPIKIK